MIKEEKLNLYRLDDIGFVGIPNHKLTAEDVAFYAQKAKESRQRYHASLNKNKVSNTRKMAFA